jgi:hypothetical protein
MEFENIQDDFESGLFYQKDILVKYNITIKRLKTFVKKGFLKKETWKLKKYEVKNETKKLISEGRSKWLKKNPDNHPWKYKNKSKPCEEFKKFLTSKKILFLEEVLISKERLYSVDILIPEYSTVVEINGNQHYNSNGELKQYYKERNDFIKSKRWTIYEVHYSIVYNLDLCELILDNIMKNIQINIPFYIKKKKDKKYKNRKEYWENRKEIKKKKYEEKLKLLKSSNIEFDKFGWVKLASEILEVKNPGKLLREIDPEFYEKCYKREIPQKLSGEQRAVNT